MFPDKSYQEVSTDTTINELVMYQTEIIDKLYSKIYGPVPVNTTEAKLAPSSVLIQIKDRLQENNAKLDDLIRHLGVLR